MLVERENKVLKSIITPHMIKEHNDGQNVQNWSYCGHVMPFIKPL